MELREQIEVNAKALILVLKSRDEEKRMKAAIELKQVVEVASRTLSSETYLKLMNGLTPKLFALVQSSESHEQLGGISAMDQLIDVTSDDDEAKIIRFSNYLRNFFLKAATSKLALERASKALGHLVRAGGTLTVDFVDFEVNRALEWLQGERKNDHHQEHRRLSACLIIKEIATNAPTLFYVYVPRFFDSIWVAIKDIKVEIRISATEALQAVLILIVTRQARHRVQWYCIIYEQVQKGFSANQVESIHGSLMVIGELLQHTGADFMVPRFKEVCGTVLKYKDSRDRLVKRTVSSLLPKLAKFCPDAFVRGYLDTCLDYLINAVSHSSERSTAYLSLGKLSLAVGPHMVRQLSKIVNLAKEGMTVKRNKAFCPEALSCVSFLAQAVGESLVPYLDELIEPMMSGGLSTELTAALSGIGDSAPSYLMTIQERLIDELSCILSGHPFMMDGELLNTELHPAAVASTSASTGGSKLPFSQSGILSTSSFSVISSSTSFSKLSISESSLVSGSNIPQKADTVLLALETLETFNFLGLSLQPFAEDCVSPYLCDTNPRIRKQAAQTCCRLLLAPYQHEQSLRFRGPTAAIIRRVLGKLLIVAVTDPDPSVRETVIASLEPRFDPYLSQVHHLNCLCVALNDEKFAIKEVALTVLGRLAARNPAYVMPAFRKTLIQLLTELKCTGDISAKEESATLLGYVIKASRKLIQPYLDPLLDVLLPNLNSTKAGLAGAVLIAIGELSLVAGMEMASHQERLFTLIIEKSLLDYNSPTKSEIAMKTLGQLAGSTGFVVQPYLQFPKLLDIALDVLRHGSGSSWSLRRETLKTLGILGALDPYKMKAMHSATPLCGGDDVLSERRNETKSHGSFREDLNTRMTPYSEDYYPTVAITALLGILRDPALSTHHYAVIQAVMFIFRSLGIRSVPFLGQIIPHVLLVMQNCEHGLRESLFQQLANLVSIVKEHTREFLLDIFQLIQEYWNENLEQILCLIEEIAASLQEELKYHMPQLIPLMLSALDNPRGSFRTSSKAVTIKLRVLRSLVVFDVAVKDYLQLIFPTLLKLAEAEGTALAGGAMEALGRLGISLDVFSDYASRIVHSMTRILEGSNIDFQIRLVVLDLLCAMSYHLGERFLVFESRVDVALLSCKPQLSGQHSQLQVMLEQYTTFVAHAREYSRTWVRSMRQDVSPPVYQYLTSPFLPVGSSPGEAKNISFLGNIVNYTSQKQGGGGGDDAIQGGGSTLHVNQQNLRRAWEASQRSTKEDWIEWMRRFSVELLRESPTPALRACSALAQVYPPLARELFNAAFLSCWTEMYQQYQDYLVRSFETAFKSESIPPEILQALLNLAEFMEHEAQALPIDFRTLSDLAEKCHAYAKALHYKEVEFHTSPSTCIEGLISINNQLGQPEAAVGILKYAQQHHGDQISVKESWFEKLQNWKEALQLYSKKQEAEPGNISAMLGKMRCLQSMGDWQGLFEVANDAWGHLSDDGNGVLLPTPFSNATTSSTTTSATLSTSTALLPPSRRDDDFDKDKNLRQQVALLGARACWSLGDWPRMEKYVGASDPSNTQVSLYRSILHVYHNEFDFAEKMIDVTRKRLDTQIAALIAESYHRAYSTLVTVQQLVELEEIIRYKRLKTQVHNIEEASKYRRHLIKVWDDRLQGCKRIVPVWQQLLSVRSLILQPHESIDTWIQFATLCRKSDNLSLSFKVLTESLGVSSLRSTFAHHGSGSLIYGENDQRRVLFAYLKHVWAEGDRKGYALEQLESLVTQLSKSERELAVRCHLKIGEWHLAMVEQKKKYNLDAVNINRVLGSFRQATELDLSNYKAWHAWALMNFQVVEHYNAEGRKFDAYIVPAINGFFRSIALGRSRWVANVQQDILRLLTLWFAHGYRPEVHLALLAGFESIRIETWLGVIPQLIARIHAPHPAIQSQLHALLCAIGEKHPQSLIYPLSVALKSPLQVRQLAAESIMATMRRHNAILVDQALLVSRELIRVAILWHEMWHEGLEEASRLYFGEHNIDGMLSILEPLHSMMETGPETIREVSFQQAFGHDLEEAYGWVCKYERSHRRNENDLNHAWDLYYHVFRRINKQLPQLNILEMQYVSPALLEARHLELAVPGTYYANGVENPSICRIASFVPTVHVITSKQRPRKVTILGDDGREYVFLLKGHEDLRQDERVMQLFGLVNALLINDRNTSKRDLKIQRYAVIPLSHNAGVVGWVPHCDTLHTLIRDYRESRTILLNIEHRLMLQMAPDYDNLCLIQKIEVFEAALTETGGQDLYKVLWLKSQNSETWLDRRTTYTRSLAVMSMVGYILGLGDRHPSNLMLHRITGTIVHIDFGDCFEVAMHREKYPEKIPFRLTRMCTNAMEVSGIEGNFRYSCESVMHVLRENRDSLMAMLEAFVHDPLINWRLLTPATATSESSSKSETSQEMDNTEPSIKPVESGNDNETVDEDREGGIPDDDSDGYEEARDLHPNATPPPPPASFSSSSSRQPNLYVEMSNLSASLVNDQGMDEFKGSSEGGASSVAHSSRGINRSHRERQLVHALGPEGAAAPRSALNQKAVAVIRRVQSKLTGRDFDNETLDVSAQVQRLIDQATSHENLCQCYIGWCPFW